MSVKPQVNAKTLGKRYARFVRERELSVTSVWVRNRSGVPELWIVTESPGSEQLKPVAAAVVDLLREYPDSLLDHHIVNASWIPGFNLNEQIPADAQRIEITG
jgi:hypothetical protein